jgi:formate dehydrogenase beta subunit
MGDNLEKINLKIDGKDVVADKGCSILEASLKGGIYIPHLCHHPNLHPIAVCRLCMVEIEGVPGVKTSCTTPAADGMVIKTKSPIIDKIRFTAMELMLANHPLDCSTCPKYLSCELQSLKQYIGITEELRVKRWPGAFSVISSNPLFVHDLQRCVLCGRCVRACHEMRGTGVLSFIGRANDVKIGTAYDRPLTEAGCRFCGACVEVCSTGALRDKEGIIDPKKGKKGSLIPCKYACPAGVDVPRYVRLVAEGKYDESYAVVREKLPLPSVCSYICLSFCEAECRRSHVNEAVGIRALKKFVSEHHTDLWKQNIKPATPTGKKVAIIGAGPAGLTAGYYLVRKGHEVTIFEQSGFAGGILRQAISRKRLPMKALNEDIEEIIKAGVNIKFDTAVDDPAKLTEQGYDAVLATTGSSFVGTCPLATSTVSAAAAAPTKANVFTGGDALLGGISEDFIRNQKDGENFFNQMVDQMAQYRGDSARSAVKAIASGRKAAQDVDKYLGGDGNIEEYLIVPEKANPYIGRKENFAELPRNTAPYKSPSPQFAGLDDAEPALTEEEAKAEAGRCLQCDLRFDIENVKFWADYLSQ